MVHIYSPKNFPSIKLVAHSNCSMDYSVAIMCEDEEINYLHNLLGGESYGYDTDEDSDEVTEWSDERWDDEIEELLTSCWEVFEFETKLLEYQQEYINLIHSEDHKTEIEPEPPNSVWIIATLSCFIADLKPQNEE